MTATEYILKAKDKLDGLVYHTSFAGIQITPEDLSYLQRHCEKAIEQVKTARQLLNEAAVQLQAWERRLLQANTKEQVVAEAAEKEAR